MKDKMVLKISEEGVDIAGVSSEKVWCTKVDKDIYRIENIPFYAFGYSRDDEVYVSDLSVPVGVENIVDYSGNSTILILVMSPNRYALYVDFAERWECECESSMQRKSLALSVPATVNLKQLVKELEDITNQQGDGFVVITQRHYQNDEIFYN